MPPGSRETYNALTNWLTDARTLASPNIVIILCGNKKDLDADREVTFLEASRFAQENGTALEGRGSVWGPCVPRGRGGGAFTPGSANGHSVPAMPPGHAGCN